MRLLPTTIALLVLTIGAVQAKPGTLERVRQEGVLRCGSAIRPGLAFPAVDHSWHGLHVELCHAIAAAVLGDRARVEFNGYGLRPGFDRARTGEDDVAFLTATEMFTNELFSAVQPGPIVYRLTTNVMVWNDSGIEHVSALGNSMICGEPGTGAETTLRRYAAAHRWTLNFSAWMELEEMIDAFNVGRCPGVIGEATALAALRLGSELQGHPSRILPEPIGVAPIMATTATDDPEWARIVAWAIGTVLAGNRETLTIPGEWVGLDKDWQVRVLAVGSYPDMLRRSLGADSPLNLAPGVNASWQDGGMATSPTIE